MQLYGKVCNIKVLLIWLLFPQHLEACRYSPSLALKLLVPTCSCLIHEPEAVETCDLSSIQHRSPLSIGVVGGNLFTMTTFLRVISLTWRCLWIINLLACAIPSKTCRTRWKQMQRSLSGFHFYYIFGSQIGHDITAILLLTRVNRQQLWTHLCVSPLKCAHCNSHTFLHAFLLTDTTQSATGFFSALSAVSFSFVNSMAVTCSMLNTFSSSMYITFKVQSRHIQECTRVQNKCWQMVQNMRLYRLYWATEK